MNTFSIPQILIIVILLAGIFFVMSRSGPIKIKSIVRNLSILAALGMLAINIYTAPSGEAITGILAALLVAVPTLVIGWLISVMIPVTWTIGKAKKTEAE